MADNSTQQFLEVKEIREGFLVLKNNALRGVMMVSSANFALKSDEEQGAIIYQFQSFLNSLDFPLQIIVQSRRVNITGYIEYLRKLEQEQQNELLRQQTTDYRQFVEQLIREGSIMAKNFFVVVPFQLAEAAPAAQEGGNKLSDTFELLKGGAGKGGLSDTSFERMKNQLWQRMEYVALGLRRVGLQIAPLNTEELIELLWSWHHPEESEVGYYPEIPPEVIK